MKRAKFVCFVLSAYFEGPHALMCVRTGKGVYARRAKYTYCLPTFIWLEFYVDFVTERKNSLPDRCEHAAVNTEHNWQVMKA